MDEQIERIYLSMMEELLVPVPGIENAFAPGSRRGQLYEEIFQANCSLCQRLGVPEDEDVEHIIDNFFQITQELCCRMFRYGAEGPGSSDRRN